MKVLIAYDGSNCADEAVKDLRRAGLPHRVEALVFSVAQDWLPPAAPSDSKIVAMSYAGPGLIPAGNARAGLKNALEEAQAVATLISRRIKSEFPEWEVQAEATYGSADKEVTKKAEEWKADLIVVGSHGRSALGRLILGSVSQKILTESRCSVRVARCGGITAQDAPARIIIGLDASLNSDMALRAVATRQWLPDSKVWLVTAVEPFHMYGGDPVIRMSRLEELHQVAQKSLHERGLRCCSVIKDGDPKTVLLSQAKLCNADAIFVGARGLKGLKRLLLGGVSSEVAARATCSVEVVR